MFFGAGMFGIVFLLFAVVGIGSYVLSIMCAIDSSKYPEWAFQQVRTTKFVWQILPLILVLVCGVAGGVIGLIWYTGKRHEVERAALAGGPPPYYGTPPIYPPPPNAYGQPPPPNWGPPSAPPAPPPVPPTEPPQ
jgi:hypothetical protein